MVDAALLLPKILAHAGESPELHETVATIAWRRAAGGGLRDHAIPVRLHRKTLIVSVADAVWQRQLQLMSAELIFRINKLLGHRMVESIEFRVDHRALKNRRMQPSADRKLTEPLPGNIVSSAAAIQDSELRARFMRAAENCISRRDAMSLQNVQSQI